MACSAVARLKETIQHLLSSSEIPISRSVRDAVEFALTDIDSVEEAVHDRLDSGSAWANALDGKFEEAAYEFIGILEDIVSDESILAEEDSCRKISQNIEKINSYAKTAKEDEDEFFKELYGASLSEEVDDDDDDDDDAAVSSSVYSSEEMVGLSDEFKEMKHRLLERIRPDEFGVVSVVGTAGSGRTFAARSIFHDFNVENGESLDCVVWVNVGMKYQYKEILANIVAQIDDDHKLVVPEKKLGEYLWTYLDGQRYLIVLDDVRDAQVWEELRRLFPEQNNGSLVLLTTGLMEVALSAQSFYAYEMPVFREEESWSSFKFGLFGAKESCPPQLEEAGKKIVQNCRGLRMALAKVIIFLCKAEKTAEYWNELAEDEGNSVFMVDDDELLEMSNINRDIRHQLSNLSVEDYETITIELAATVLDFTIPTDEIKKVMFPKCNVKMEITAFYGMAGIGKTTFAKKIFDDPTISRYHNCRVWVTLGPKYNPKGLLVDILAHAYPEIDKTEIRGSMKLVKMLRAQLSRKRLLIVLDDVRNTEVWDYLHHFLPKLNGEVLVTTREEKTAQSQEYFMVAHKMQLLNEEESWCLFRQKVFGEEFCPLELEKVGKKISNNCGGLPLFIVTVAYLLRKDEKTQEWWSEVARFQRKRFNFDGSKCDQPNITSF